VTGRRHDTHPRDTAGTTSVLVVGLAVVAAMLIAVVVDASAAYLQRQSLNALADGAALAAADGVQGEQVYTSGLGERAAIDAEAAERYVVEYLRATEAASRHHGLTYSVQADAEAVVVQVSAPAELPFRLPGARETRITGTAASFVIVSD
jgi:hypothetical protein